MIHRDSRSPTAVIGTLAFTLWALVGSTAAAVREPLDLVPGESVLVWNGRPLPDTTPLSDSPSTLQTLLELGTRLAGSVGSGLDSGTQLYVRMAEMFGLMIRYPHALALIDASAKPTDTDPTAQRVDRLRCVLIVQNEGHNEPFLRVVQKVINEQTDSSEATLATRSAGPWSFQELRDQRLPGWAVIAWGEIEGHFVLTVGDGVWPSIASIAAGESRALNQDAWYAAARLRRRHEAIVEIFVDAQALQARLDPLVDGRASAFLRAWDAGALRRAHWALGLQDRALFCVAHFRIGDDTLQRVYADPAWRDPRLLAVVPDEARYAIYRLPLGRFMRRFFQGLVVIQPPKIRRNIERIWADIEAKDVLDVDRDLLAQLGEHAVVHNYPLHPLRIPVAVTVLIEIQGESERVRRTIDTICTAFGEAIEQAEAEDRGPPPWRLHREDDGVWHIRLGPVAGPAWAVTERFIVLSWSPLALRSYLEKMGSALGGS